ncbi:flagellar hook-associated protein FlgK [Alcaligenaceae bacterium]|nr:flagellar hook-associated protein FlgK [Alcaligenaceae bacterium]
MNLANLGLSGLMAAQNRMQTAGHNLNNADTEGYNRQTVLSQTAGATATSGGYIGRGVQAVTVQRSYDNFLQRQLGQAQSNGAELVSYGHQVSQINNLFADRTVGISPALQRFFDGMDAVASAPSDGAARQELIGRSGSLVTQINQASQFLKDQQNDINTQITTVVTQVNSYVERIQDLNKQITVARATTAEHEPNDLLDQRDQLVSELNQLVGVKATDQEGTFSIALANGQVLLGGNVAYPLHAQPSAADPSRMVMAYTQRVGPNQTAVIEMKDDSITGGTLGGLMKYRAEALDSVQNELGRLAVGLAMSVNEIHKAGQDLNGAAGGDFFSVGPVKTLNGVRNSSNVQVGAEIVDANGLTGQDYRIDYDGANYSITRLPNGHTTALNDGDIVDGVEYTLPNPAPAAGDSWTIQPTRDAASSLSLVIDDPAKIAAGEVGAGSASGDNALKLAALRNDKSLSGGTLSLNEAFSQIVNRVGVMAQQNGTAAKAQASLIQQNYSAQQALSGVNVDEEVVNLMRFQDQYRAAARLIDASTTLFDTLLGLRN